MPSACYTHNVCYVVCKPCHTHRNINKNEASLIALSVSYRQFSRIRYTIFSFVFSATKNAICSVFVRDHRGNIFFSIERISRGESTGLNFIVEFSILAVWKVSSQKFISCLFAWQIFYSDICNTPLSIWDSVVNLIIIILTSAN